MGADTQEWPTGERPEFVTAADYKRAMNELLARLDAAELRARDTDAKNEERHAEWVAQQAKDNKRRMRIGIAVELLAAGGVLTMQGALVEQRKAQTEACCKRALAIADVLIAEADK